MYYLVQGRVRLVRHTENGQAITLFDAKSGDFLAEASLFSRDYHCDCIADENSALVRLRKSDCLELLARDQTASMEYIERLSKQLMYYRRRIELISIKPAKERVWAAVCDGWLEGNISSFASTLDLTPEATYRALADLVKEGRVLKTGHGNYDLN